MALIKLLTRSEMAGLFFCLASTRCRAFLLPCYNTPNTSVYSAFCAINAVYTAHAAKQCTGLYCGVSCYLPCFAAAVWRVHPAIPHRLRHVGAYHSAVAPPAHTRYQRHAGRCTGQRSRPIIIRYIRVQRCALLWIHAKQCSISQTIQARRLVIWHRSAVRAHRLAPSTRRGSRAAGGAAASLFGLSPDS